MISAAVRVRSQRPPAWLIIATGVLAATCLVLAVAETNLWAHYFIDTGEFVSLFGLAFILMAGFVLYRQKRLLVSLPLVLPWLLYPVITQGDQIIDNLSINPMRAVTHILLAAIFGTPVLVVVLAARYAFAPRPGRTPPRIASWFPGLRPLAEGRTREGIAMLGASLLVLEIWVADAFLGTLMIVTLIVMIVALLWYASLSAAADAEKAQARSERTALIVLLVGVAASVALYVGYKNRPGAYQGSPSAYLDPVQRSAGYPLDRIAVLRGTPAAPRNPDDVHDAFEFYGRTLDELLVGYHILDRNYTYDFHNELFIRHTPLIPDYRKVGLSHVAAARALRAAADSKASVARLELASEDPLRSLLDDVSGYVAYNFDRAPTLEKMSDEFERTQAGLQHAAHLYEGESKMLGQRLSEILAKYRDVLQDPRLAPVTSAFATKADAIYQAYAHHVVGF